MPSVLLINELMRTRKRVSDLVAGTVMLASPCMRWVGTLVAMMAKMGAGCTPETSTGADAGCVGDPKGW